MTYTDFEIKCANCGQDTSYLRAWKDSLSHTYICGEKCHKETQLKYSRFIVGENPRLPK